MQPNAAGSSRADRADPTEAGPPAPRVLFIAGLGRSGSTLLDRVLGQVPGCCSIGEASQVWRNLRAGIRCGCGQPPRDCPFWGAVMAAGFGGWHGLDLDEAVRLQRQVDRTRFVPLLAAPVRPASFTRTLDGYTALLSRLYRAIAEVSGAELIIDSGKHTSTAYLLRHVPGIDPRVVHLVRDSRGVAYSWTKVVKKSSYDDAEQMDVLAPQQVARSWLVHNTMLHGLPATGLRTARLRYEDFAAAPREQVARVLAHAGQPDRLPDTFLRDGSVDLSRPAHTLAGNPLRFRREPVAIRSDEAWRAALPRADRRTVTTVTSPLLLAYRYPLRPGG